MLVQEPLQGSYDPPLETEPEKESQGKAADAPCTDGRSIRYARIGGGHAAGTNAGNGTDKKKQLEQGQRCVQYEGRTEKRHLPQ